MYQISKLLDQFCEGMKRLCLLPLIRGFPELFAPLFTFTGDICIEDVKEAVFIHSDTVVCPDDAVTFKFLLRFIQGCEQGVHSIIRSK